MNNVLGSCYFILIPSFIQCNIGQERQEFFIESLFYCLINLKRNKVLGRITDSLVDSPLCSTVMLP